MRNIVVPLAIFMVAMSVRFVFSQNSPSFKASVPKTIQYSGILSSDVRNVVGRYAKVGIRFSIYKESEGGAPLWQEINNVAIDQDGKYSVALGANNEIPISLFLSGEAHWLGIEILGVGSEVRTEILSVPYSISSGNADSLGGIPANQYVRKADQGTASDSFASSTGATTGRSFTTIASGVNSAARMIVGSGAYIMPAGSGIIDSNHYRGVGFVEPAEFGYLHGLTAPIQGQLANKQEINRFPSLLGSDQTTDMNSHTWRLHGSLRPLEVGPPVTEAPLIANYFSVEPSVPENVAFRVVNTAPSIFSGPGTRYAVGMASQLQDAGDGFSIPIYALGAVTRNSAGLLGVESDVIASPGTGQRVRMLAGFSTGQNVTGEGTVDEVVSFREEGYAVIGGTPTVHRTFGLKINNHAGRGDTLNAGIYISDQGQGQNDYAIYSLGGKSHFGGPLIAASGIQWTTAARRPPCSLASRGTVWYSAGDQGEADVFEICLKDAADSYTWKSLH